MIKYLPYDKIFIKIGQADLEIICLKGFDLFFSERTTLRSLYAISRPSVVRLLSVTLVHPTQAVELFGNFFSPYDSSGTLLFWCQKSLVGDAPFPLKICVQSDPPPLKQRNFDKYRLIAPQP